ncbi:MAG: 3-oxoacyl-ACP reductase FabG [Oscillospiraceae bacterium]|nr:3-oxoacyl-ACP reductase FabG [Oscillospiraceae bacterium]
MKPAAVITGASGGIGQALAGQFAAAGYRVFCGGFCHPEQTEQLVDGLRGQGYEAAALQADLSSSQGAEDFARDVLERCGSVDVLVNNAGVAQQKLFQDITDADWRRMMGVNLDGVFYLTRALLPAMIRQKQGRIINISSIWGICGASCEVHYSAAKAAVAGMTRALAKEVGPSGITVNCIAPGVIQTPMLACFSEEDLQQLAEETPLGRLGTGNDVAALALFLASDQAGFITGQVICVDGGFAL